MFYDCIFNIISIEAKPIKDSGWVVGLLQVPHNPLNDYLVYLSGLNT